MRSEYTYANAGINKPPDFFNLQVVDLDTGGVIPNVREVDCLQGWAIQSFFEPPYKKVVHGRFALDYIDARSK